MATLQEVERAFMAAHEAGDADSAKVLAQEVQRLRSAEPQKQKLPPVMQGLVNVGAGAIRGAGSIGATAFRLLGESKEANEERRRSMDQALNTLLGAEADSLAYQGGKVGAEVAGTLGAGGVLAKGAQALKFAPQIIRALQTGGMSTGGGLPRAVDLATRTLAGGTVGGVSSGLVNPEDAGLGSAVGAAIPGATQAAGYAGQAVGRLLRGPEQLPGVANAVQAARAQGYVIPPTQAKPTLTNRLIEGMSGKITTAQNASARNQVITNKLAAESIGLPSDTVITPEALKGVRQAAGQAYEAVSATGTVTPGKAYIDALDDITAAARKAAAGFPNDKPPALLAKIEALKSESFDAASAVAKISQLREEADVAYRAGDKALGKGLKAGAKAVEDALDDHLVKIGAPADMLDGYRQARTMIAKTYTVEGALNPTTGTIDARKLGAAIKKGKPVTGGLREAGEFANRFPKAAQPTEGMGSLPQTSPLDWTAGTMLSLSTANPLGMLAVAARPVARASALSPIVQNRLIQQPGGGLRVSPELAQLLGRAAPAIAAD